jgi:formate-dependent nitrite reductase cytochrome c552 subunit
MHKFLIMLINNFNHSIHFVGPFTCLALYETAMDEVCKCQTKLNNNNNNNIIVSYIIIIYLCILNLCT